MEPADRPSIEELIASRRPGYSLPQAFYTDPRLFELDLDKIFRRMWLFVGVGREIPHPGDYFTFAIGHDSVIVVRDAEGEVQALFNTCRHRGSRICTASKGRAKHLVCPYHRWVYGHDGKLIHARWMGDDFDKASFSLQKAHVQLLCDYIFVCLGDECPEFDGARRAIEPQLAPHRPEKTKICHTQDYDVAANWKVIIENNRECYHCGSGHPQFMRSNYDLGMNADQREDAGFRDRQQAMRRKWQSMNLPTEAISFPDGAWYRCERMPLKAGFVTETLSGAPSAPLLGDISDPDCGSLRVITLPNAWYHANCDYLVTTCLLPIAPDRSLLRLNFLVHEDAEEGTDYRVEDVTAVWEATSKQDWTLCENNHAGISSSRYVPGPLSSMVEQSVDNFVGWYLRQISG